MTDTKIDNSIEEPGDMARALRDFWWHMCKRIANDANIQYYCGSMTETLRLAVEAYGAIYPNRDKEVFRLNLLSTGLSEDADVCRLKKRISNIENGIE